MYTLKTEIHSIFPTRLSKVSYEMCLMMLHTITQNNNNNNINNTKLKKKYQQNV